MRTEVYLRAFRKRLLHALVDRESVSLQRFVKVPDKHFAELAEATGLTEALLREAIALARLAAANVEAAPLTSMLASIPLELRPYLTTVSRQHGFNGRIPLFMSALLHAAMQTEYEPARRRMRRASILQVVTDPHPKGHRVRRSEPTRGKASPRQHLDLSVGLSLAIRARAERYGVLASIYCELWALDAIDGLLPKGLLIEPVKLTDFFPRPENYVLPASRLPDPERID